MTNWQEVDATAFEIAIKSPNKMYNRATLKTNAEEEGQKKFVFQNKSGSRSKYVESNKAIKREKQSTEDRNKEISLCSLELELLTKQSANKQKQISQANDLKDFETCATLHKELRVLLAETNISRQTVIYKRGKLDTSITWLNQRRIRKEFASTCCSSRR